MRTHLFAAAATLALAGAAYAAVPADPPAAPSGIESKGWHHRFERRMPHGPQTKAEAEARAKEMFARLDLNKDGVVTREEAKAAVEAFHAKMEEHHQEMAAKRFDALDTNHDGQLSRAEFTAAGPPHGMMPHGPGDMPPPPPGAPPPPGEPGAHHWAGGRPPMGPMGPHHGEMMLAMFDKLDADKDGKITLAEAVAAADARFAKIDTNGDGTISEEERHAARAAHREKWMQHHGDAAAPPSMM